MTVIIGLPFYVRKARKPVMLGARPRCRKRQQEVIEMCLIADNETLSALVAKIGKENGYDDAGAEFQDFKEFRIRWSRTYTWIRMEVSDYLKDTEESILESILRTLFGKIKGTESEYSEETVGYLTSHEFVERNQGRYIERARGLTADSTGVLEESVARLRKRRLVREDGDLKVLWDACGKNRVGNSSALMKVASVNAKLKDADENVLDFAVYSQIANVQMGFNQNNEGRIDRYRALLDRFDGREEAEKALEDLGITLRSNRAVDRPSFFPSPHRPPGKSNLKEMEEPPVPCVTRVRMTVIIGLPFFARKARKPVMLGSRPRCRRRQQEGFQCVRTREPDLRWM